MVVLHLSVACRPMYEEIKIMLLFAGRFCTVITYLIECRCISMGQGQEIHARNLMNLFMASVSILLLLSVVYLRLGLFSLVEILDSERVQFLY